MVIRAVVKKSEACVYKRQRTGIDVLVPETNKSHPLIQEQWRRNRILDMKTKIHV